MEVVSRKRVNVKGHYRVIERNKLGQIISSKKWSPRPKNEQCPRCSHFTLEPYKGKILKKHTLFICSRCGFKSIRDLNRKED